jgi:hypothetical protein
VPHKVSRKPRPPERDYFHRALLDKLGVKPEQLIAIVDVSDQKFLEDLASRAPGFLRDETVHDTDLVFLGAESVKTLSRLKSPCRVIRKNGAIWVVYLKGQSHFREIDVIAAGKAAGLTDNKVARFSDTHTALRFVIPLARR